MGLASAGESAKRGAVGALFPPRPSPCVHQALAWVVQRTTCPRSWGWAPLGPSVVRGWTQGQALVCRAAVEVGALAGVAWWLAWAFPLACLHPCASREPWGPPWSSNKSLRRMGERTATMGTQGEQACLLDAGVTPLGLVIFFFPSSFCCFCFFFGHGERLLSLFALSKPPRVGLAVHVRPSDICRGWALGYHCDSGSWH